MITIVDLIDTLADFVSNAVQDYQLPTGKIGEQKLRAPQVVKYFLPAKDRVKADFPCVIVRPIKGTDDLQEASIKVRLIIGTYAEDEQGIVDSINILERIRLKLYEQDVLANKYCLEKPCHYEIPEEQPIPEWFTSLELKFNMFIPVKENAL